MDFSKHGGDTQTILKLIVWLKIFIYHILKNVLPNIIQCVKTYSKKCPSEHDAMCPSKNEAGIKWKLKEKYSSHIKVLPSN